jgi:hypothetical protein
MMDEKQVEGIMVRMEAKSTGELREILGKNDAEEWTAEAFEAARRVLAARKESAPAGEDSGIPVNDAEVLQFKSVGIISQGRSGNMRVTHYNMSDVRKHVIPEVPSRTGRYAAICAVISIPATLLLLLLGHGDMTAENLGAGFLCFGVIGALVGGAIGRASTKGIEMLKMREAAGRERPLKGAWQKDFTVVKEDDWEEFRESLK